MRKYYDKMLLAFGLSLLAIISIIGFFNPSRSFKSSQPLSNIQPFEFEIKNGLGVLTLRNTHRLMPGNTITTVDFNGSDIESFEIKEVIFRRRAEVEVNLKNGQKISGKLTNQDELILGKSWQNLRQPLTVSRNRKTINISLATVESVKSDHKILFSSPNGFDLQNFSLSFYQRKNTYNQHPQNFERPTWKQKKLDENETNYDLFTPPVIYLVDGKLSTNIPQEPILKQANDEEFGMELIRFSNEPYPYKLVSWIGETPYFEDTQTRQSPNSSSFVRNRLEVGIPYKKNKDRKGGQPSLVLSTLEDEEKQLVIEKFVVQQYRDEKTGGMKIIGRALVKDFQLGGKSFEINNQMKKVYAGNIKIEVRMTLNDLDNKTFTFTTKDMGISFDFGDRLFTVVEIDEVKKTILVNKKGPKPNQQIEQLLKLP